ncbi:MAG: hypothetical protein A3H42_01175 [Deltaproteobacteria bacterium RIFCSPLOWO2_02_FULL_46_8]|nr:MAG: hypothetical protein A3H42_01175 [Deltaproteobacteria bacterium RIFCSPLOWO2_02_FULL_46_8]
MKTENNIAFKEWATVVNALAERKQILILRKGGIQEESGEFQMECGEFFLFPTYEHQNRADLKSEAHADLELAIRTKPTSDLLPIQYYVKTESVIQIADETELERLRSYHIWSDEAVKKRFHYGRQKELFVIACRIFKLPSPHVIKVTPEYAGCKSWVGLKENLSTQGAKPVLSEVAFQNQWALISSSFVKS